jgi:hypothetical protein
MGNAKREFGEMLLKAQEELLGTPALGLKTKTRLLKAY